MIVFVPIGKRYTATVTKSRVKTVVCETCKSEFSYEAVRKSQGFGDSWLWLDNKGAEARSLRSADKNCDKLLAKAVDFVPCSNCGWYQKNMVAAGKRKRFWYTTFIGFPAAWLTQFWEFFGAQAGPPSAVSGNSFFYVFFGFAALGAVWAYLYNPNKKNNRLTQKQ